MRFLHIGYNICGIPSSLARVQKLTGHEASVVTFIPEGGHPSNIELITWNPFIRIAVLWALKNKFDVFHFHCITCTKSGIDLLLWKLLGKKIIIHYHGSEIRNKKQPWFHKYTDATFVSTPDLLEFAPTGKWLPNPIFLDDYPEKSMETANIITHAPTNPEIKGTKFLQNVMPKIQKSIQNAKLNLVTDIPYQEAIEKYRMSTIMVDQLRIGWYGMVALEAMAMKIPVICYIRQDLKKYIPPFPPLKYTDINMLEADVIELLQNTEECDKLSIAGYNYVKYVHDPIRISNLIISDLS